MDDRSDPPRTVTAYPYTFDKLVALFAECAETSAERALRNPHLAYFREYFAYFARSSNRPITVVQERPYPDRDFRDDYAAYYVHCANGKYKQRCSRLHFFQCKRTVTDADLASVAKMENAELVQELCNEDKYLGYIVVKPLPFRFIGRTCLKTYEEEDGKRHYKCRRPYLTHLLGLDLTIESVAFQEQDRAAAACATSALWSVFHCTGILYHHHIPSPIEITRSATERVPSLDREIPNHGLNPVQMASAIKKVGLEPAIAGLKHADALKATAYAYLKEGNPVVLNAVLFDRSQPEIDPQTGHPEIDPQTEKERPKDLGGHAVALMGYSIGTPESSVYPGSATHLRSSHIDKLYAHDDQVGPFARLTFDDQPIEFDFIAQKGFAFSLGSSFGRSGAEDEERNVRFAPDMVIVPLHPQVQVGLDPVLKYVFHMDQAFEKHWKSEELPGRYEWDVFLTTSSKFRTDVRNCGCLGGDVLHEYLDRLLPRFVWRAIACFERKRVVEFLFDATDIEQGDFLLGILPYES